MNLRPAPARDGAAFAAPALRSYGPLGKYCSPGEAVSMKRRLLTGLVVLCILMGSFQKPAQAATLRFRNDSNAYVHLTLIYSIFKDYHGVCVAPHASYSDPLQEEPKEIHAQFYKGPKQGPSCSGPVEYDSVYTDVWRTGIEFWAVGNDADSYRFYHN